MDGEELAKQTLDQIPQANANANRITGLVKEGGRIAGYQLSADLLQSGNRTQPGNRRAQSVKTLRFSQIGKHNALPAATFLLISPHLSNAGKPFLFCFTFSDGYTTVTNDLTKYVGSVKMGIQKTAFGGVVWMRVKK